MTRGIALGGELVASYTVYAKFGSFVVIGFVTLLHGLTPKLGVHVMNVSDLIAETSNSSNCSSGFERVQDCYPSIRSHHR